MRDREVLAMNPKIKSVVYSYLIFVFLQFSLTEEDILLVGEGVFSLANTCILFGLFLVISHVNGIENEWKKNNKYGVVWYALNGIVSFFFAFVSIMGKQYSSKIEAGIIGLVKHDNVNRFKLALITVGGMLFFATIIKTIMMIRQVGVSLKPADGSNVEKVVDFLCGKFSILKQTAIVVLFWLPHIIISYPGRMVIDSWSSYRQYIGEIPYTTQHPMFYTRFLGDFFKWGEDKYGEASYGLFALVLFQTALTILAIAYTLWIFKKLNLNKYFRVVTMLFFAIVPSFVAYQTIAVVDSLYCPAFLFIMDELLWYMYCEKKCEGKLVKKILTYVLHSLILMSAIILSFARYNGTYVVKITLAVVILREIVLLITKKQKVWWTALVIAIVIIPLNAGAKYVDNLNEKFEVEKVSTRAMYAIPLQQVARCLVYYGDDVTEKEWKDLSRVFTKPKEYIISKYKPSSFDNIKWAFNNDATDEDIKVFLKTWIKLGKRHPGVYINALCEQTYYLFSPLSYNQKYYATTNQTAVTDGYDMSGVIKEKESLREKQEEITQYYYDFAKFPIVGLLTHQALYSILLLGTCVCALCRKKFNVIVLAIPMLVTLLIAFVGPANYGQVRYTLPIMYGILLLMGAYLFDCKKGEQ